MHWWSEIAARFIFAKCARIHRIAMAKKDEITGEVLDRPGQVAVPVDGVEIDAVTRGDDEAAGLDGIRTGQTAEKPPSRLRNGRQNQQPPLLLRVLTDVVHQTFHRLRLPFVGLVEGAHAIRDSLAPEWSGRRNGRLRWLC